MTTSIFNEDLERNTTVMLRIANDISGRSICDIGHVEFTAGFSDVNRKGRGNQATTAVGACLRIEIYINALAFGIHDRSCRRFSRSSSDAASNLIPYGLDLDSIR